MGAEEMPTHKLATHLATCDARPAGFHSDWQTYRTSSHASRARASPSFHMTLLEVPFFAHPYRRRQARHESCFDITAVASEWSPTLPRSALCPTPHLPPLSDTDKRATLLADPTGDGAGGGLMALPRTNSTSSNRSSTEDTSSPQVGGGGTVAGAVHLVGSEFRKVMVEHAGVGGTSIPQVAAAAQGRGRGCTVGSGLYTVL